MPDPNIIDEVLGGAFMAGEQALPGAIVIRKEYNEKQGYAGVDDSGQISDDVSSDLILASAVESLNDLSNTHE